MKHAALQQRPGPVDTAFGLCVSTPGDVREREAEQVADRISAGPLPPGAQRKALGNGPAPSETRVPPALAKEAGAPLSVGARRFFEPRFGRDLGGVRVHQGASSEALARRIDARAFTLGSHIFFGAGEYAPETVRGRHLLAHELTHTLQAGSSERLHRKTLTDIPDATRAKLRVWVSRGVRRNRRSTGGSRATSIRDPGSVRLRAPRWSSGRGSPTPASRRASAPSPMSSNGCRRFR